MAPHNSERGPQNEFSAPWSQHSQLQLNSGDAFSSFSDLVLNPLADSIFSEYNATISDVHRQYPSTATRYQHLNLAQFTSPDYVATDIAAHSSLPSIHSQNGIKIPGVPNIENGSDGPSAAPGTASATTTTSAETHQDTSTGVPPALNVPTIPTAQRRSRTRKPASQEWERHKKTIEHLYLKQNLSLMETITEMRTIHQFYATEKMYKDMFKQWKWSKNLPRDMAVGMLNKAKQRQPKQTIFQWGHQTWTVDRIKKTHGKFINQSDSNSLVDYPTPQGVTCETPREIETSHSPNASEKPQAQDSVDGPVVSVDTHAPRSVGGIDEGPFRLNLNQSSTTDMTSVVKAALKADEEGDEAEAEWGLRDALSCSSRLLSSTHEKTVEIGYMLASFYARKKRLIDAYDILNWMTNKHLGSLGANNTKTVGHLVRTISLLRRWLRNGEAELLIYRLLESLQNPEGYPIIPKVSTGDETVSKKKIGELLASSDEHTLTGFLPVLDWLACDSQNYEFLQDIMPQIIERCDIFQQTYGNLAIRSRCILAEILIKRAQYERARSVLGGCGRPLKHKVDSNALFNPSTLKLVRRVASTFFRAKDPDMCDKVIKRVVTIFDTGFSTECINTHSIFLIDFLLCTASDIQKTCEWERIRPWVERALSLYYPLFGPFRTQAEQIEHMLETHKVEPLFLTEAFQSFHEHLDTLEKSSASYASGQ